MGEENTYIVDETLVVGIDQGTSSSRALIFSSVTGQILASHQIRIRPSYPASGWIELNVEELYETTVRCLNDCVEQINKKGKSVKDIAGVGVTNQRETTIVWDRNTGKALAPAIVWSDARTAELVRKFTEKAPGKNPNAFQQKTGLPIHSYFSALKLVWLLENVPDVAEAARCGSLLAGTVDCWLIWRLTNRESHVTDVTNASRTNLFNLYTLDWDLDLCKFYGIDPKILPRIVSSSELVGTINDPGCAMAGVKICGILGDQQASLLAQTWPPSNDTKIQSAAPAVKVTYGTGAFMLWDIGEVPYFSRSGILTTVASKLGKDKKPHYALEGAISFAGATMDWLRYRLNLFSDLVELDTITHDAYVNHKSDRTDSCYLVPAFSGLFCPWWQESARTVIAGVDSDTTKRDLVYAGLRAAVYQTYDVLRVATMATVYSADAGALVRPEEIVVDGGMAGSAVLMQSLADILDMVVRRHNHSEVMAALGAAVAATLALEIDPSGLLNARVYPEGVESATPYVFSPTITSQSRHLLLSGWHAAIERSLGWTDAVSVPEGTDSLVNLLERVERSKDQNNNSLPDYRPAVRIPLHPTTTKSKGRIVAATLCGVGLLGIGLAVGIVIGRQYA
ncbi:unnamed protein product [Calicophoron daubneyi]|uniref:glycerol kinase n=1 Tax=Calicophoron daubneyi TaxID=300641 RepID=A0AAV2TN53_CALDB